MQASIDPLPTVAVLPTEYVSLLSRFLVVVVEFTEEDYIVDEGAGQVEVCLFLNGPIATPLTVYVEASEATPTSATGKLFV